MRRFQTWASALVLFSTVGFASSLAPRFAYATQTGACTAYLKIQEKRFHRQLGLLRDFYSSDEVTDATSERLLNDVFTVREVRTHFFRLQALLRIYQVVYGVPLSELFVRVKEAEDRLGLYGDRIDFYDAAVKLYRDGHLESLAVIRYLKVLKEEEKNQLAIFVKSIPVLLNEVEEVLSTIEWSRPRKDRREVGKFIDAEISRYADLPFDMNVLEAGIHEMRRKFRWLLLYIQSLEGLVALKDDAGELNMYRYLLTHPMAKGPFTTLNPSLPVKNPIVVPRHYFLALSKVVEELGTIKAVGEIHEAWIEAYVESGAARSEKEARDIVENLLHKHPKYSMNIYREAEKVKAELEATSLITAIRREIRKSR